MTESLHSDYIKHTPYYYLYYPLEWMKVRSSTVLFPPEATLTSLKNLVSNTLGKDVLVQLETISAIQ